MTQLQKSGGRIFVIFNYFSNEKAFVRENKLKSDLAPEVGGTDFWSFLIVPGDKIYLGKQTKKCPSSRSRGGADS